MRNCFLLLLLALFKINSLQAETIVVTNNADSGPGSLREAILQAATNGTITVDSIVFNIADTSRTARTITILDQLPDLTSNCVVDGSTQQGAKIGQSDAKVILLMATVRNSGLYFFNFVKAINVQIYGFFFYKSFSTLFNPGQTYDAGIRFNYCDNVTIGKPGKGNYFRGVYFGIFSPVTSYDSTYQRNSANVLIQSNVFGHNENGEPLIQNYSGSSFFADPVSYAIRLDNAKNVVVGGDLAVEGNSFFTEEIWIRSQAPENGSLIFKNNNAGTKTDGTVVNVQNYYAIRINLGSTIGYFSVPYYKMDIINNVIVGGFEIGHNSGFITVQGNKLFSPNNTANGSTYNPKLSIYSCTGGGIIGGDLPEEQNQIFTESCIQESTNWNGSYYPKGVVVNSSPNIAIIKNKTYSSAVFGSGISVVNSNEPVIRIESTAVNVVKGKATPGCTIEVFLDDSCWACDGEIFLGRTTSNADSSWSFTGTFNGVVIATAAKADSSTSGYTEPIYRLDSLQITQPTCGLANGSLKGIYGFESTESVEWHRIIINDVYPYVNDSIVATTADLLNVPAGAYYFVAKLGQTCHSVSFYYNLRDYTPVIDETKVSVTQPSCGLFNGSVSNILVNQGDFSNYRWANEQNLVLASGDVAASGYISLPNLSTGKYRLIATDNRNGCADTSNYFTLVNQSGPSLNLNGLLVALAKCGNANGSITGISGNSITGNPLIQWTDTVGNIVGNSFNLQNIPAGKYRLQFKDQSSCDTITTPFFEVKDTSSVMINTANIIIKPAGCGINNGGIENVEVANATGFTWKNMNGLTTVANTVNVSGLASGQYQLTASNASGCSASSATINVPNATFSAITVTSHTIKNASCNNADGKINITSYSKAPDDYSFQWTDSISDLQLAVGNTVSDVGKGFYILLATDSNGCEEKIFRAFVDSLPTPQLSFTSMDIINDVCGGKNGSINGITIKNLFGPTVYKWLDVNNNLVGNGLELKNVGAGNYYLSVNDAGCGIVSSILTVSNNPNAGLAPQYNNVIVPKNSPATLTVGNFETGEYLLFADAAGLQELQRNTNGTFTTTPIIENTSFYVKHVTATCISPIVKINVTTVDNSYFTIAKAFTPNGDLINNKLTVRIVGYIKLVHFRVFNRFGQVVFETSQINDTWDGKLKGKNLPEAAYVWIAEGTDITGKIIRDQGTVVILR